MLPVFGLQGLFGCSGVFHIYKSWGRLGEQHLVQASLCWPERGTGGGGGHCGRCDSERCGREAYERGSAASGAADYGKPAVTHQNLLFFVGSLHIFHTRV